MYSAVLLVALSVPLHGADARAKPSDYPVSFKAGDVEYGAEYMVRSIHHAGRSIVNNDYLVVEIAVYPPAGKDTVVSAHSFMLRINGKKDLLHSQTPGIVAASVKYPDWERERQFEAGASAGDSGVILGRRQPVERFPGDRRPASTRMPNPVPPVGTKPEGVDKGDEVPPEEMVTLSSLPEGSRRQPGAGHVYFAWRGKLESIRTVELLTRTASGDIVTRRLR